MNDENSLIYVSQSRETLIANYKNGYRLDVSEFGNEKYSDLHADGSTRSWKTGVLDLNILREDVFSIDVKFLNIEYVHLRELLINLKNRADGGFYASVFNIEKNEREVLKMYRSDRTIVKHKYRDSWRFDFSVSLIQL